MLDILNPLPKRQNQASSDEPRIRNARQPLRHQQIVVFPKEPVRDTDIGEWLEAEAEAEAVAHLQSKRLSAARARTIGYGWLAAVGVAFIAIMLYVGRA